MNETVQDLSLPVKSPLTNFLRTPINWLLVFVPITLILERFEGAPAPLVFFSAGIAIVPALICRVFLSGVVGQVTSAAVFLAIFGVQWLMHRRNFRFKFSKS